MQEDRAGALWIATWGGGIKRLDRERNKLTNFRHDPDDPKSLSHDSVFSLHEDENGVLWIGTSAQPDGHRRQGRRPGFHALHGERWPSE
ncbi:MAG: hypothetical protein E2P02_00070 [Acidobacteria bacterium]|nr:MAG: hypothetical protein E2P02_00070 [Acidobacteriota bacterium]